MGRDSIVHGLVDRLKQTGALAASVAGITARRLVSTKEASDAALGEALLAHLDEMKGMAMKVGQILSYMDGAMPPGTQEKLRALQRGVEPLDFAVVESLIQKELGDHAFTNLQTQAIAAASIGQVHRARRGGVEVAVKIQYPHVRETFETDMKTLHRIAALASAVTAVDGAALVEELRARVLEECDYLREAHWQERFHAWFATDAEIVIPRVIRSHCTHQLLTSEWQDGLSLYEFMDFLDEESTRTGEAHSTSVRQRAIGALLRFSWVSYLHHRTLQADPHPGNFLFLTDGRVACLDFGCVRVFEDPFFRASVDKYASMSGAQLPRPL